jgi:hypothetical protein
MIASDAAESVHLLVLMISLTAVIKQEGSQHFF